MVSEDQCHGGCSRKWVYEVNWGHFSKYYASVKSCIMGNKIRLSQFFWWDSLPSLEARYSQKASDMLYLLDPQGYD